MKYVTIISCGQHPAAKPEPDTIWRRVILIPWGQGDRLPITDRAIHASTNRALAREP